MIKKNKESICLIKKHKTLFIFYSINNNKHYFYEERINMDFRLLG